MHVTLQLRCLAAHAACTARAHQGRLDTMQGIATLEPRRAHTERLGRLIRQMCRYTARSEVCVAVEMSVEVVVGAGRYNGPHV